MYHLFRLFDNLLHNLLDHALPLGLLAGLRARRVRRALVDTKYLALLGQDVALAAHPSGPLVEDALAGLDDGGVGDVDGVAVLVVELAAVLAQVAPNALLFVLGQQRRRPRPPQELLQLLSRVLRQRRA